MKFSYNKRDNSKLFSSLEKKDSANISQLQNYIPLYHKFFTLNQSNYNSINLDQSFSLYNISEKESDNKFEGTVKDKNKVYELKNQYRKLKTYKQLEGLANNLLIGHGINPNKNNPKIK